MSITIYTDGSALGNPGPGGYGTILMKGAHYKEISKGYRYTTNNRMELLAVIEGLRALKQDNQEVVIYSDSKYVVDSISKGWIWKWIKTGFKGKKNKDLWLKFIEISQKHKVTMVWVKGHADNKYNNKCDELAVNAAKQKELEVDIEFEAIKDKETNDNVQGLFE